MNPIDDVRGVLSSWQRVPSAPSCWCAAAHPEELLDLIEAKGREVAEAVAALRALRRGVSSIASSP
jgi:hypothetical protein